MLKFIYLNESNFKSMLSLFKIIHLFFKENYDISRFFGIFFGILEPWNHSENNF